MLRHFIKWKNSRLWCDKNVKVRGRMKFAASFSSQWTLAKSLCPDQWKFAYSLTRQALIKLIVVFMLSSINPLEKINAIDNTDNEVIKGINDRLEEGKRICTSVGEKRSHGRSTNIKGR